MICQACGVEATTKYVAFYQNIGALFIRFPSSIEGELCKSCIHDHFWKMTGTTMFLGWWGFISFCVTPCFLLNNIGRYLFALSLPPVPPGAQAPQLNDDAIRRIRPHLDDLFSRLESGETFEAAVAATAERAGATPGQVAMFVHAVIQAHRGSEQRQQ